MALVAVPMLLSCESSFKLRDARLLLLHLFVFSGSAQRHGRSPGHPPFTLCDFPLLMHQGIVHCLHILCYESKLQRSFGIYLLLVTERLQV